MCLSFFVILKLALQVGRHIIHHIEHGGAPSFPMIRNFLPGSSCSRDVKVKFIQFDFNKHKLKNGNTTFTLNIISMIPCFFRRLRRFFRQITIYYHRSYASKISQYRMYAHQKSKISVSFYARSKHKSPSTKIAQKFRLIQSFHFQLQSALNHHRVRSLFNFFYHKLPY